MPLFPFENPPIVEEHPDLQKQRQKGPVGGDHFSAKYVWDGHSWKGRDFGDCPFGNRHYIVSLSPDIHYAVYCEQCEQHGREPLVGERLPLHRVRP